MNGLCSIAVAGLVVAAAVPGISQEDAGAGPAPAGVELPDGPAAKVLAGIAPNTRPAPLPAQLVRTLAAGWDAGATWSRWAELVAAEASGAVDPARRAALCLLAREHGRADDAWRHFERLGGAPEWAAAVLPHLVPGVPVGTPGGAGGLPGPLPDGAVLRPLLPPRSPDVPAGTIEWRSAAVRGLLVGGARLDLAISVENTGVQVDVDHAGGGAARLAVLLPEPAGYEIRIEYTDWMRQDTLREPLAFDVQPGEERTSLYGRFRQERVLLPTGVARALPAQIVLGGLRIEVPADEPDVAAITAALARLLAVEVRAVRAGGADPGWTGTTVRLPGRNDREGRGKHLRYLASAVEEYVFDRER